MSTYRNMTIGLALIPIVTLVISLIITLNFLGAGPHIPLVFSTAVACLVALKAGYKWEDIEKFMLDTMSDGLQALVILLIVGILIGTWIISGVVPTMIYYGLRELVEYCRYSRHRLGWYWTSHEYSIRNGSRYSSCRSLFW